MTERSRLIGKVGLSGDQKKFVHPRFLLSFAKDRLFQRANRLTSQMSFSFSLSRTKTKTQKTYLLICCIQELPCFNWLPGEKRSGAGQHRFCGATKTRTFTLAMQNVAKHRSENLSLAR